MRDGKGHITLKTLSPIDHLRVLRAQRELEARNLETLATLSPEALRAIDDQAERNREALDEFFGGPADDEPVTESGARRVRITASTPFEELPEHLTAAEVQEWMGIGRSAAYDFARLHGVRPTGSRVLRVPKMALRMKHGRG